MPKPVRPIRTAKTAMATERAGEEVAAGSMGWMGAGWGAGWVGQLRPREGLSGAGGREPGAVSRSRGTGWTGALV
jgi:hypothetical protein